MWRRNVCGHVCRHVPSNMRVDMRMDACAGMRWTEAEVRACVQTCGSTAVQSMCADMRIDMQRHRTPLPITYSFWSNRPSFSFTVAPVVDMCTGISIYVCADMGVV